MSDVVATLLLKDFDTRLETMVPEKPWTAFSAEQRSLLRTFLSMKQGMCCFYCRQPVSLVRFDKQTPNYGTFEHLVDEWSDPAGKSHDLKDVVISCYTCNQGRNTFRNQQALKYFIKKSGLTKKEFRNKIQPNSTARDLIQRFGLPKLLDIKPRTCKA